MQNDLTAGQGKLTELFEKLDRWRNLPSYKLEPRVDAFIALYLPAALKNKLGIEVAEIIPEFPLRKGTLKGEDTPGPNHSVKVDFLAFDQDRTAAYLIEVKTDQASRRSSQDTYLLEAATKSFGQLVDGLRSICLVTDRLYVQKYVHLLAELSKLGFVTLPDPVLDLAFPTVRSGILNALRDVSATEKAHRTKMEILYVQPEKTQENSIGFKELASVARRDGDPFGLLFAEYLDKWSAKAASLTPAF